MYLVVSVYTTGSHVSNIPFKTSFWVLPNVGNHYHKPLFKHLQTYGYDPDYQKSQTFLNQFAFENIFS